ncbi:MAG: Maf family protein [Propionibacteriaceae bacterium]|nr:Maf family protein [Propionibacteriaceae bacterium]
MRFVLASASPARLRALRGAGVEPEVVPPHVDESAYQAPSPGELATLLARTKAEEVFARLDISGPTIVVGCDSLLEFDGLPYGKPGSAEAAIMRWYRMRGRQGVFHTGHHVIVSDGRCLREANRLARTLVRFADLTDAEIAAYAATGEPARVAGGFTIDALGGPYVTHLEGDPHTVTGLSLPLLRQVLLDLGIVWHSLWEDPGHGPGPGSIP